jgi:hypothetical protein
MAAKCWLCRTDAPRVAQVVVAHVADQGGLVDQFLDLALHEVASRRVNPGHIELLAPRRQHPKGHERSNGQQFGILRPADHVAEELAQTRTVAALRRRVEAQVRGVRH